MSKYIHQINFIIDGLIFEKLPNLKWENYFDSLLAISL